MTQALQRQDPGFIWMLVLSTVFHLTCYFLLVKFQYAAFPLNEGPVYYVDIVNLPVANPRAGAPSSRPGAAPSSATKEEMVLPEKSAQHPSLTNKLSSKKAASDTESEKKLEERLSSIKKKVAEKEFSDTMSALRNRVANGGLPGKSGIPGGKGKEAGSDYAGYIRSRLTDAFRSTISYRTKNPEVMASLTIDRNGRLIGLRFVKKSNDRIFEDSVHRAILKAEPTFPPPPNGEKFEFSYRFAPEGVSNK
jgi:colicin import membrane protein